MIVQCPKCLRKYRLQDTNAKLLKVKCKSCAHQFLIAPSNKSFHEIIMNNSDAIIMVADIQRDFRNFIISILTARHYNLLVADDGEVAWNIIREKKPNVLLINPYLPKLMGIDIITKIRDEMEYQPKIFLLAAIHSKKRYRRRPESLYGADDYIDEGMSEKQIIHKLSYHLGIQNNKEDELLDNEAVRLARSIFADLLVYETEKVEKIKSVEDFFNTFSQEALEAQKYLEELYPGSKNLLNFVVAEYLRHKHKR